MFLSAVRNVRIPADTRSKIPTKRGAAATACVNTRLGSSKPNCILIAIRKQAIDANLATAIRTVVILIFVWPIALLTSKQPLSTIKHQTWLFLILSGVATGLSWLCYFRALQLGEASRVAPVDKLSVVIAIAFAALFLHEHLSWQHWVGGTLIFTGAVVLSYP